MLLIPASAFAQIAGTTQPNVLGGNVILDSGPRTFYKQSADPACIADRGKVYTKYNAVTGDVDLYYINDNCDVVQITSGGVTPVGSVDFLGVTAAATYDGDQTDYDTANGLCATDMSNVDARVCTNEEMLELIGAGEGWVGTNCAPCTGRYWVNGGAPGFSSTTKGCNDCIGWSDNGGDQYARFWNLTDLESYITFCNEQKAFACCK